MTEEEEFNMFDLPICDQQAFASMLELAMTMFLDMHLDNELDQTAVDLWILYAWCRRMRNEPVWGGENGEPVSAPELNQLTRDNWEQIVEEAKDHFIDYDIEFEEMALLDDQPHWPTHQEFRKAKAWLLNWYGQTRWNRKAD